MQTSNKSRWSAKTRDMSALMSNYLYARSPTARREAKRRAIRLERQYGKRACEWSAAAYYDYFLFNT